MLETAKNPNEKYDNSNAGYGCAIQATLSCGVCGIDSFYHLFSGHRHLPATGGALGL